jgi:5-methylcytosine-specific restriction protein A
MYDNSPNRLRGRKWTTIRTTQLKRCPLCVACDWKGVTRAAQEVDHVIPLSRGGSDDFANLQSLCIECHKTKTAIDMGWRQRTAIGIDGWPVG